MVDKKTKNRSYFSADRNRKKRYLLIIIPVIAALAIAFIVMGYSSAPSLPNNKMVLHNHASLNVTYNGRTQVVPQQIGIASVGDAEDPLLYGDHSLDKYGMEGMSPLHTHDASGTIHVEANTLRDYKLGEFLNIWKGLDIDGKTVQATVNGDPAPDFRNIILNDADSITLNVS